MKAGIILLRGPLGVGKTTIAEQLARKLHGVHISIDDLLHRLGLDQIEAECIPLKNFLQAAGGAGSPRLSGYEHNRGGPKVVQGAQDDATSSRTTWTTIALKPKSILKHACYLCKHRNLNLVSFWRGVDRSIVYVDTLATLATKLVQSAECDAKGSRIVCLGN